MRELLREVDADMRDTARFTGRDRLSPRVREAMAAVARHDFVPAELGRQAYANRPLPIGSGQTISQPYIVALMTELLDLESGDRVLDIGTGSGYQAAVLAELVEEVYTIEIVEALGREAAARLERVGYDNARTRIGDGWQGWPDAAPFDAILIAAATPEIPPPLVEQMAVGARMILPLAAGGYGEELTVVTKRADGGIDTAGVLPVRFVPLTGDRGG